MVVITENTQELFLELRWDAVPAVNITMFPLTLSSSFGRYILAENNLP